MRKRFGRHKKDKEPLDVDITSLLDILVILLVFLLKSYNASDLKLEVAKDLKLPPSKSQALGHLAPIVQVSSNREVWINNEKIGLLGAGSGEKVDFLFDRLSVERKKIDEKLKEMKERSLASVDNAALKSKEANKKKVNIVLDQSLPYSVLRKVMHTSALAGFPEFKFIVQGNH
jgi:biopolymer transport protein ExbD